MRHLNTRKIERLIGRALFGFLSIITFSGWGAEPFTVDPDKSTISLSGTVLGSSLMQQGPGSLSTRWEGKLNADVVGSTIQFTSQSLLTAQNGGSWQPKADASAGTEPANYGGSASIFLSTAVAAVRNIELQVTSPAMTLSDGKFDSSGLTFTIPTNATSELAYSTSGLLGTSGTVALAGYATNRVTSLASLATVGNQEILTIPVDSQYFFSLGVSPNDIEMVLKGQLVASRSLQVPMPFIQSITVQTQAVTLQWKSSPGDHFQVRSTGDFTGWQTRASDVTSVTSDFTWTGAATAPQEFFQLTR